MSMEALSHKQLTAIESLSREMPSFSGFVGFTPGQDRADVIAALTSCLYMFPEDAGYTHAASYKQIADRYIDLVKVTSQKRKEKDPERRIIDKRTAFNIMINGRTRSQIERALELISIIEKDNK